MASRMTSWLSQLRWQEGERLHNYACHPSARSAVKRPRELELGPVYQFNTLAKSFWFETNEKLTLKQSTSVQELVQIFYLRY